MKHSFLAGTGRQHLLIVLATGAGGDRRWTARTGQTFTLPTTATSRTILLMFPILGRLGPFFIYTYTVILGGGLVLALALTAKLARGRGAAGWPDAVMICASAGLVAGRLAYIVVNGAYFADRPVAAIAFWQGGLTYTAALPAALLALWLWARRQRRSVLPWLTLLAPGIALLHMAGWTACLYAGCAYGRETTLGWLAADLPDLFGVYAVRYLTQPAGILLSLLALLLAGWLWRRGPRPWLFWLILLVLSAGQAMISLGRGDPAPAVAGWRIDTIVLAGLALVGFVGVGGRLRRPPSE